MMLRVALVILVLLALPSPLLAQAGDFCAETFDARLADAKQALAQHGTFMQEYEKARPALEWFEAHCRFLEDLERVARRADDPNAFVCDPKAGPQPKGLTAELVLTFSTLPTVGSYQERGSDNDRCLEADKAARIPLVLIEPKAKQRLETLCYRDERPNCVKARAAMAAAGPKAEQLP